MAITLVKAEWADDKVQVTYTVGKRNYKASFPNTATLQNIIDAVESHKVELVKAKNLAKTVQDYIDAQNG